MQPDCGESPCTPNTLIRKLTGTGWRAERRTSPFFLTFRAENHLHVRRNGTESGLPAFWRQTIRKGYPMLKLKSGLAAGALSVALALTSIVPAEAVTFAQVPVPSASSVEKVQYRYDRRAERRWHGHRGYRYYRPGYRRHSDGWWYPLAAFGAGAIIGGAIANDGYSRPRYEGINPRHTDWCYARYRSYRAYDNTFQPNYGPRRECLSPYY